MSIFKTRIAPTPSGYLHLGNILSFALTAAMAQKLNASILLRIDDMDRQRAGQAYLQDIFDTLNFLELPWHEGPRNVKEFEQEWSQQHRMPLYNTALQQLADAGKLFACTCTRSQLRNLSAGEPYPGTCCHKIIGLNTGENNWRLLTNGVPPVTVNGWPAGQQTRGLPPEMEYFVVRKKDGCPAYQLSSLVDDLHFGITHIVRGADLWPSTLAQLALGRFLQADAFQQVQFYHHGLLLDGSQQKLSKSAGATSVNYLRSQGYKPAQVYGLIGTSLGITGPLNNWQQLAAAYWRTERQITGAE
jgi:glutamyl/glutaminyl-tRNA synthetase